MFRFDEAQFVEREVAVSRGGRAGLVRNRFSRRNRRLAADPWWRNTPTPDFLRVEPDTPEDLIDCLKDFASREVGLVVIDGGDGTVRDVLTALPHAYGDTPPAVAVLASGTTNLIASDVGAGRSDPATLAWLAHMARTGPPAASIQRRPVLEVSWPDGSRGPVNGMFLGAAAFTRATDLSVRLVRQGRIDEGAGVAATLISALAQTVMGSERDRWMQGDAIGLAPYDLEPVEGDRFVMLATTLNKLILGIWPFWGEGEGGLRYLDVLSHPRRLATAFPAVLRGRPRPWMADAGYRSGVTSSLDMTLTEPFVIDGELFNPGPGGMVRVRAGQVLDFIVP